MLYERYAPGKQHRDELYHHNGEEAGFISGKIEVTVGETDCSSWPGGAYFVELEKPDHRTVFTISGDEDALSSAACTHLHFKFPLMEGLLESNMTLEIRKSTQSTGAGWLAIMVVRMVPASKRRNHPAFAG